MLPEGWKRVPLGECARFQSGGTPSKERGDYWGGDFPWVTAKDMKTLCLTGSELRLTKSGKEVAAIAPALSVLVLTRGMTLLKDLPVGLAMQEVSFNQDVKALIAKDGIDPWYLAYQLVANKSEILDLVDTAGHGTGRLDTELLKGYEVSIAPQEEQRAAAQIIRAWEAAIATAEKLLANSRRQKQALMWGLLSGKRRFDSPAGSWQYVDFDQVFERVMRKNSVCNANVLTISGQHGLISQRDYFNKSVASANLSGYTLLERGEFAYNKSYSAGYPMGAIKPLMAYDAGVVSSLYLCFRLRADVDADLDFFRHYFEAGLLNEEISGIAQEGARNHGLLNVSVTDFFKLRLHIPPAPVQRKIAEAINVAEAEERWFEQELIRFQTEKRALMQQLLTGKRRVHLPVTEAASA